MNRSYTHPRLSRPLCLTLMASLCACLPGRSVTEQDRILEPVLPTLAPTQAREDALAIRISSIRARAHIRNNVLHRTSQGEIQTDAVWTWSVPPALYFTQALDLVASADPKIRLTDEARKGSLRIELLAFEIQDNQEGPMARISILVRFRGADRKIQVREYEQETPIQGEMPRSLAKAMGTSLVAISREVLDEATKLLR